MPQRAWTQTEERQYRHILDSELERGRSNERAKEIAARTVNKQRRERGKTDRSKTTGTGNPSSPLEERTRAELYNRAKQLDINGRSSMSKDELIEAIRGET